MDDGWMCGEMKQVRRITSKASTRHPRNNGSCRTRPRCRTAPKPLLHHQPLTTSTQITGANGTIGTACVEYALAHNYHVRCIVRRPEAFNLIAALPSVQPYLSCLSHALVPDNAAPGAYDDALAGARYVVHIAGVWPLPVRDVRRHDVNILTSECRHCIPTTTYITLLCTQ